jgi:hypothetical protein
LMARLTRDLAGLVPMGGSPFGGSQGFAQMIDQELRRSLGMSPIDPADLAQHGFAVDGSAAIFSSAVFPTFLIPVADRGRVEKLIEAATKKTTVIVAERRGIHYTTWTSGELMLGFAVIEGYLVLHVGLAELEKGQTAWLDEVLDAGAGIAIEGDAAWAFDQAGPRKEALGVVRAAALGDALRALEDKLKTRDAKGCEAIEKATAGLVGRVAFSASLGDGKVDGAVFLEVSKAGTAAVAKHLAASPDARYLTARGAAGFHASTGLDLDWTSALAREFGKRGCGSIWALLAELELWRLSDPFAALQGKRIFSSYHAAVLETRVVGQNLDMKAVAWLGVADDAALQQVFDLFVAGPFRSSRTVAGQPVTRLDLSLLGWTEPIDFIKGAGALRVGIGAGMIERLLSGNAGPAGARELFSLRFQSDKFTDLAAPLGWLARKTGASERDAEEVARMLARFRWFALSATLEDAGIRMAGGFELR